MPNSSSNINENFLKAPSRSSKEKSQRQKFISFINLCHTNDMPVKVGKKPKINFYLKYNLYTSGNQISW